jgi:hypothetical protein
MSKSMLMGIVLASVAGVANAGEIAWNESAVSRPRPSTPAELAARLARLAPGVELGGGTDGGAITCRVLDPDANRTVAVPSADFGEQYFWLEYRSDGEFDRFVQFIVLPNFEGSPLAGQVQLFPTNDITNVTTPFGIPTWGLDATAGQWLLIVRNDRGGQAVCPFEVVSG